MRSFFLCSAGLLLTGPAFADTPVLTVLTYDSFAAEWGPGPAIKAAFESQCACDLRFVTGGDGAALLSRLRLEGARTETDVVLGLDTNLMTRAAATGLFVPHGVTGALALPIAWSDPLFLPFDWGWFAFVSRTDIAAPASFRALADSDLTVILQDPRASTPGLGLVMWVRAAYGDQAPALWADLADNIVTVTPGWSEAYGLFLQGEADAVLSYATSPAYHLIAEGDAGFHAWRFDEGHYLQIEVAAMLAGSDQPDLARQFMAFILTPAFQGVIPTTNWMFPAIALPEGLPEGFMAMEAPKTLYLEPAEAAALRDRAVEEWRTALSQ